MKELENNDFTILNKDKETNGVTDFFKEENELVHSVYYKDKNGRVVTYYITLKNDCTENRSLVFEFFDKYEMENKVSFLLQFVPLKLVDKFSHFNKLAIN